LKKDPSLTKLTLECDQSIELIKPFLNWIYSASITMPEDIFKIIELYFLAYDYQVVDLMDRCENELVNRISAVNVTELLVLMFPHLDRQSKHARVMEEDAALSETVKSVAEKYAEQMKHILSVAKHFFLTEFTDVLLESSGSEIEKRLASVPGLITSIFQHIAEQRLNRRQKKLGKVTFSNVEEV
jgi:hypothetical protein